MAQGIVKCELCEEDKDGIWFCTNCHQSLCEGCKVIHLRANISKHHEIISRKDMFQTQGESARHVDEYCKSHTKEIYILFCKKCQCPVCRLCLTEKHAQHSVIDIEKIFHEQREKGEKCLKELSQKEPSATSDLYGALEKEITDEATRIRLELDAARDALLKDAKNQCQSLEKEDAESKEKREMALKKLNRSLQSNKVSEIMEAVKFYTSMAQVPDSAPNLNQKQIVKFVPGNLRIKQTRQLLGRLEITIIPEQRQPRFVLSYVELDPNTMCLRYCFPEKERKTHEKPVAQLAGQKPFSTNLREFSIKIKNEGQEKLIGIGIAPKDYWKFNFPGWGRNSYGYHADDGGIFCESGGNCAVAEECYEGDIMKCRFEVATGTLSFLRNGNKVYTKKVSTKCAYYPVVALETPGEEVILLEEDPWFL